MKPGSFGRTWRRLRANRSSTVTSWLPVGGRAALGPGAWARRAGKSRERITTTSSARPGWIKSGREIERLAAVTSPRMREKPEARLGL